MNPRFNRYAMVHGRRLKRAVDAVAGFAVISLLRIARLVDRRRFVNLSGALMRRVGPWLPEHRTGRANLAAAFPEKSSAEIETILVGAWDNLGRVAAEFAHLDRLTVADPDCPDDADVVADQVTNHRFKEIRAAGRPMLLFAAHLANWEVPALTAARVGINANVLFRPPSIRAVSDAIVKIRAGCMVTLVSSRFDAPIRLARALERGISVGMLVDQHDLTGVDVTFFGRTCKASPLLAKLARHVDCPIRGARVIRLPDGHRFQTELTAPLDLPRDAEGLIDVQRTMQAVTSIIEGWVREYPEQWLWQHRRWR